MSRLHAEWEKQSGVQLTWPLCETESYELEKVVECYVEIASTILRFEPLMIVTRDIEECKGDIARISQAKGIHIDVDSIKFYECPLNDTWARDHGGISVFGEDGQKYLYDFVFNGWGLKFPSDLDNQITKNIFFQNAFNDDVLRCSAVWSIVFYDGIAVFVKLQGWIPIYCTSQVCAERTFLLWSFIFRVIELHGTAIS